MPDIVFTILMLIFLLQIKHMFADFFLQTSRMLSGRATYLHVGRAQHAAVHAILSVPVFLLAGSGAGLVAALAIGEWVVHFHIDWAKARYGEKRELKPSQALYWNAFGVDQLLHQMTYVAMIGFWAVFT